MEQYRKVFDAVRWTVKADLSPAIRLAPLKLFRRQVVLAP
jgi:hypothetical protein